MSSFVLPNVAYSQLKWYRIASENNGGNNSALTTPLGVTLQPIGSGTGGSGGNSGPGHIE